MKKLFLPIFLVFASLFFFSSTTYSQETDCRKIFDQDLKKCSTDSNSCQKACSEQTKKPDGTIYFNSGEIYTKCIKESQCDEKRSACGDQALTDLRACGKTGKQPEATKTQKQGPKWLEFLGINPYQTWLRLKEIVEVAEFYASGDLEESLQRTFTNPFGAKTVRQKDEETVKAQERAREKAFESFYGKDWREQIQQFSQPKIDAKAETDAWSVPAPKAESVIDVSGTTDTKRYSWDENSGAVVKSNDWEKIKFREPVEVKGLTSHTLELGEGEVEVRVRNNNPTENQFGVDAGWLGVTVSRTHFRVLNDRANKVAAVSVYEGEVKIKTQDGQTITAVPDGDKPGVVVVTQKLSPVKLALAGLVLAAGVGGIVWFLKKKKN